MPVQILRASHLESCRSSAPVLKHSSFVLGFWHSLASRDELEAAKLPKQTIKRLWQPNADASTWKRSGTRGHKKEKYPTAYLLVGWQEFKIIKLKKTPSFKAPLHVVNLPKALREKKGISTWRRYGETAGRLPKKLQKCYALECHFVFQHFSDWNGLFSFYLRVYFYKEVWATFGFTSYESMKGFQDTCWVSEA